MRNQGNGPSKGGHAKPTLFRSLEDNRHEQATMLGLQGNQSVPGGHGLASRSAQLIDFVLALYILALRLPPTHLRRMNNTGIATVLLTIMLLLTVCGSVLSSSSAAVGSWMVGRSVFYLAGIVVWALFINVMTGAGSASDRHFSSLRWNHFVPLVVCVAGLLHSLVIRRNRREHSGYEPQQDEDLNDIVFRGEHSF